MAESIITRDLEWEELPPGWNGVYRTGGTVQYFHRDDVMIFLVKNRGWELWFKGATVPGYWKNPLKLMETANRALEERRK